MNTFTIRKAVYPLIILAGLLVLISSVIYLSNRVTPTSTVDTRYFTIGVTGTIESLHPPFIKSHEERLLASTIYEGLLYYDEDSSSVKPLLARDWKYSTDGKSLTINLNKGTRFHNGKRVRAQDVKNCWENSFFTTTEWSNASMFMSIQGSKERLEGQAAEISGIQVLNDGTIKVNFIEPNAAFIYMLTSPIFWIYDTEDQVSTAPGTGPFIFKENQEGQEYILDRNTAYHRGIPQVSGIKALVYADDYQAFGDYKEGKLDFLDSVPLTEVNNIKSSDAYKDLLLEKSLFNTYSLGFNLNREPFAGNYKLRRAINYAIDRNLLIEEITGGIYRSAGGVIPLGMTGYNRDMRGYKHDLQKAQQLLEESGYPLGEGLPELVLSYNDDPGHKLVVESVSAQLNEIGIKVQLQPMKWDYYKKQLLNNEFSFFRLEWIADYPDPDSFLYSMFHSSKIGISNYYNYHNPQVDKILDTSRAEVKSHKERIKLMSRAEEIIVDDAPCVWLFQSTAVKILGPEVSGLKVNGLGLVDWFEVKLKMQNEI